MPVFSDDELAEMERQATEYRGRPDDAWVGQYHLGSEGALMLVALAREALAARAAVAELGKRM